MSKRRHAVILFADIAGYTARMQQDENLAKGQLQAFREAMQTEVAAHHGEIVHFYGDGCLVLFNLPQDAAQAGISLQAIFQQAEIPVRIGIHSGTVNVDDEHVYGDAINVASRVESMSVPGAVLLSKRVRDELKNQPAFQLQSLGSFAFKNVEEPMEVFALANEGLSVPRAAEMKGKGEPVSGKEPRDAKLLVRAMLLGFVGLLAGVGIWLGISWESEVPIKIDKSIAVLPFKNMSNDPEQEYFSDGVSEDILTNLARIGDLKVIARTSAFSFKKSGKSLTEIATELKVAYILEGSVRRDKDKVRITTQLFHVESGALLWAEEFNRSMDDIFAVQQEVAREISRQLKAKLTAEESQILDQKRDLDPKAYALYLKAHYLLFNSSGVLDKELLEEAISIDSTYADAYAALGFFYLKGGSALGDLSASLAKEKSQFFFQKALELDPQNGVAYGYLGMGKLFLEWDFQGAATAFEKAKTYKGNWLGRSLLYLYTGRLQDAKSDIETFQKIDPLHPAINLTMAMALFYQDSLSKATNELSTTIALHSPNYDVYRYLAKIDIVQKKYAEAIDILETGIEKIGKRAPYLLGELGVAYFYDGQVAKTEAIIAEIKENWNTTKQGSPAFFLGLIYANMGEIDVAFEWLEKSYQDHEVEMLWLKMDPLARPLHGDPRYQDLLDRVGFP